MSNPRIKERYLNEVVPALMEKFQYKSNMQVPKIVKVAINKGIGVATADKKLVDVGVEELTIISGQKAVPTIAKKSVSNFKLREGMPIGARVTLRGDKMYEFIDRLISVALPRVRDFRGINEKGFDGRGNFSMGIQEQIIFPEIDYDKVDALRGLDITITTTAKTDAEGRALLAAFSFPLRN